MLKKISLSAMAFAYLFAGAYHFTRFDYFLGLVPSFLPSPRLLVTATGVLEIVLSFFLAFAVTRKWACYTILLLIGVALPIDVSVLAKGGAGIPLPYGVLVARLPFHVFLMAWAWWHSRAGTSRSKFPTRGKTDKMQASTGKT